MNLKNLIILIFIGVITTPTTTPTPTITPVITATATSAPTIMPAITTTATPTPTANMNPLDAFVETCMGYGHDVSCIYVDGILALHLMRGDGRTISYQEGTAQVWDDAWKEGQVIGILAHDGSEGQKFYELYGNIVIYLIWTDGKIEMYGVSEQTVWRNVGEWKIFEPWEERGSPVSEEYLRNRFYRGGVNFNRMVLQTCIGGNAGIMFVVAYRISIP